MGRQITKEEEAPASAPEWMVTFSDCITLLLCFFVLLLTFASMDVRKLEQLGMAFRAAFPSKEDQKDAILRTLVENDLSISLEGTETRPPEENVQINPPMTENEPLDFRNLRVFKATSREFFLGQGAAISEMGRKVLDAFAIFLKAQPGRMVISEHGAGVPDDLGLDRAMAVVDYLAKEKGVDRGKFSVSSSPMSPQTGRTDRMLEITMLERSVYE